MRTKNGDHRTGSPTAIDNSADMLAEVHPKQEAARLIHKILVPIDFSECSLNALEYAGGFAGQLGARLAVLHVVEPGMHADNYLAAASALDPMTESLLESSRDRLSGVCQKHLGSSVQTELLVRMGRAPSEIVDTAKALGADMIVMGTHGHTGLKHVLLGSTAERVLRQASCPVTTIRPV